MEPSRFVQLVLDLHNKYSERLGINDVYAYRALGRVIRAVGIVILSPKSPLALDNSPKTFVSYLLNSGTVLAMTDFHTYPISDAKCPDAQLIEVTNDLYRPPSTLVAINIVNCNNSASSIVREVSRRYGVRLEVWVVRELGMEDVKLVFRGSLSGLRQLARLVVIMTGLANVRNLNEADRAIKVIDDSLKTI